jgi:hypothetical protein
MDDSKNDNCGEGPSRPYGEIADDESSVVGWPASKEEIDGACMHA